LGGRRNTLRIAAITPPLTRRDFLRGAAGLGALSLLSGCGPRAPQLNFYNWSLYIGPETLNNFTKASGVSVNYDEFSSADVLFAKIKIGVTGYDLIVAPGYLVHRMIRQNLLYKLPGKAPREALVERFQGPPWDPELEYSFPYLWGTTGVAYQKDKVDKPKHSWDLLWDPKYSGRLTVLDEKRDAIGAALFHLGFPGNSTDPQQLEKAKQALLEQKPLLRKYSSDVLHDLVVQETWAGLAWSGDSHQAQKSNEQVDYYIPAEGTFIDVDNLCIPRTANSKREAMDFINFYAQPAVAADITNSTGYPNPIAAAFPLIDEQLRKDPIVYPSEADLKNCVFQTYLGPGERLWDALWEEVKR
jgi:spermidine/putrescine transport system substrate-binding protein